MKIRSVFALLLLLSLSLGLAGCGDDSEYYDPIPSQKPDTTVLASGGEWEFTYELFRFFFMGSLSVYDGGDRNLWRGEQGSDLFQQAKEDIFREICELYATFEVAKTYGIDAFGETVEKQVNELIKADIEGGWVNGEYIQGYGSVDGYVKGIEQAYHATDAVNRLLYRNGVVLSALRKYMTEFYAGGNLTVGTEDLEAFVLSDSSIRYNHVFVSTAGREDDWAKNRIESIWEDMQAALSYEEMVTVGFSKSSDIPDGHTLENGMWTSKETLDRNLSPLYYDTLVALPEGALSDVIQTENGYYILYKMKKPMTLDAQDPMREDILSVYLQHIYHSQISEAADLLFTNLSYTADSKKMTGVTFLDDIRN